MSNIAVAILLLGLTFISLFVVSIINRQQMRSRLIQQKLNQMKRRAADLEELSVTLEPLVESKRIPLMINEEAIDILVGMTRLMPNNHFYSIQLDNAKQRSDELVDHTQRIEIYRLMESDAAIARALYALNEAAKVIRRRQANGHLEVSEMEKYISDLAWASYMVRVISNVGQGHKALNRGDTLRALAFYRKALEIAIDGNHKDERQNRIIAEIGEILNGKRLALSSSLMPESLYNPGEKTNQIKTSAAGQINFAG